jgi:hypothetical protein
VTVADRSPVRVVLAFGAGQRRDRLLHQPVQHLEPGTHGQRQQALGGRGGDLGQRDRDLLGDGQPERARLGGCGLVLLAHGGPLPRGVLGGSPETYQTARLRWGTTTSRSTNRGTTSITAVRPSCRLNGLQRPPGRLTAYRGHGRGVCDPTCSTRKPDGKCGMAAQPHTSCRPRSTSRLGRAPTFQPAFPRPVSEPGPARSRAAHRIAKRGRPGRASPRPGWRIRMIKEASKAGDEATLQVL